MVSTTANRPKKYRREFKKGIDESTRRKEFLARQNDKRSRVLEAIREMELYDPVSDTSPGSDQGQETGDDNHRRLGAYHIRTQQRLYQSIETYPSYGEAPDVDQMNEGEPRKDDVCVFFARHFMHPDFMVEIPEDLTSNWLMTVRPQGANVHLITRGAMAILRDRNGRYVTRFRTHIPSGTILHCFMHSAPKDAEMAEEIEESTPAGKSRRRRRRVRKSTRSEEFFVLYIFDVLMWKNVTLGNNPLEARYWYLKSRLNELDDRDASPDSPLMFLLPALEVSAENLTRIKDMCASMLRASTSFVKDPSTGSIQITAEPRESSPPNGVLEFLFNRWNWVPLDMQSTSGLIEEAVPEDRRFSNVNPTPIPDGVIFRNKSALYIPGSNPLNVIWKPLELTQWFLDSDDGRMVDSQQKAKAFLDNQTGEVLTQDGVLLHQFEGSSNGSGSALVRIAFDTLSLEDGLRLVNPSILHRLSSWKQRLSQAGADNFNRLVSQHFARCYVFQNQSNPIGWDEVLYCVENRVSGGLILDVMRFDD